MDGGIQVERAVLLPCKTEPCKNTHRRFTRETTPVSLD